MLALRLVKNVVVTLATLGILFPQLQVLGDDQNHAAKPVVKISPNSVLDLKLNQDGVLTGRTINHEAVAATGVKVVVKQGDSEIAQSVTDDEGNFAVKGLKAGVYQVGSGATVGVYRVWSEKTAPPSAMPHCLLILGE